jgi:tRNA threonylcarbamoyladenosine biosynthesis protein TsaE
MDRTAMEFELPDSNATESLGRALAVALPDAVYADEAYADAVHADAAHGQARFAAAALAPGKVPQYAVAPGGAVLYLLGDLGAGKTTCVRSLLRALGVTGLVRSPTYTLVETYTLAALTCVHVDLYRLQVLAEVDELGLRDMLGPGALLLVEWPEKGVGALPSADVALTLSYVGEARRAELLARTPFGVQWLQNLARDTSLSAYVSNLT